jgi:hypothetical protein
LNVYCTLHGLDGAGKLRQEAIARRADDVTPVLFNQRIGRCAVSGQGVQGADLIFLHQAAVAFDIGMEDRRKLTFDILGRHGRTPLFL